MTTETPEPISRREVWLRIALAVAQGLPEPKELSFYTDGEYRIATIEVDTVGDAAQWSSWFAGPFTPRWREVPATGRRVGKFEARGSLGWQWEALVRENLPTEAERDLAAELAAAILTPDALATVDGAA